VRIESPEISGFTAFYTAFSSLFIQLCSELMRNQAGVTVSEMFERNKRFGNSSFNHRPATVRLL
jgi:hypothetical protein